MVKRLIPILFLSLFLSGCAAFAQFRNPIGITQLAQIESSYGLVVNAAVGYRRTCANRVIPRSQCAPVVAKLQAADRTAQTALRQARKFVKENPTLDAYSIINGARGAIAIFQEIALENGLKIGN